MYTIEDYENAKAELAAQQARWDNYAGNNPNKYRGPIESAKAAVHLIETELKASGILPRTQEEIRDAQLDQAFPNARSKQTVDWNGEKYMRCYQPISKSLSGKTVTAWRKFWVKVAP